MRSDGGDRDGAVDLRNVWRQMLDGPNVMQLLPQHRRQLDDSDGPRHTARRTAKSDDVLRPNDDVGLVGLTGMPRALCIAQQDAPPVYKQTVRRGATASHCWLCVAYVALRRSHDHGEARGQSLSTSPQSRSCSGLTVTKGRAIMCECVRSPSTHWRIKAGAGQTSRKAKMR